MRLWGVILCVVLGMAMPARAQMVKSSVVATNGMSVSIAKDEFAGRSEFSSVATPIIGGDEQAGTFKVVKIIRANAVPRLSIQGMVSYRGSWRFFESAIFKGGDPAEYLSSGRDVLSCRYGYSYLESFIIFPTPEQIKAYANGAVLPIQVRGRNSAYTFLLEVPLSLIAAIEEVAK